jgi:hypothetical protein
MIGANILRLKPEIYVKEGKMVPGKKYRGNMATVVMDYVEDTLAMFDHPDLEEVFITYSTVTDGLVEQITARLKKAGFKHIMATRAAERSPAIAAPIASASSISTTAPITKTSSPLNHPYPRRPSDSLES